MAFTLVRPSSRLVILVNKQLPRGLLSWSRGLGGTSSSVGVSVTPEYSSMDEASTILVSGLGVKEAVTLWLTHTDDAGLQFTSHAHYSAQELGVVDVGAQMSQGGKYTGWFPQGLMSTMRSAPPVYEKKMQLKWARLFNRNVTTPMVFKLSVLRGHLEEAELYSSRAPEVIAETEYSRWLMAPGVTRQEVETGSIWGTLFTPPGEGPHPLVLDLFGSHGGKLEYRSAMLASKGFASMVMPYFGYKGLPKLLKDLNVEYFLEGIEYLQNIPTASGKRVGIIGSSKGGEIALVVASIFHDVKAVISINPYNVSVDTNYLYKGEIQVKGKPVNPGTTSITINEKNEMYAMGHDDFYQWDQEWSHPVEKIPEDCHVLIVAGCKDIGLGHRSAIAFSERARHNGKNNIYTLVLPGAGHIIDPPYHAHMPAIWNSFNIISKDGSRDRMPGVAWVYGGEAYWTCRGSETLWARTRELFKQKLVLEAGQPFNLTK